MEAPFGLSSKDPKALSESCLLKVHSQASQGLDAPAREGLGSLAMNARKAQCKSGLGLARHCRASARASSGKVLVTRWLDSGHTADHAREQMETLASSSGKGISARDPGADGEAEGTV